MHEEVVKENRPIIDVFEDIPLEELMEDDVDVDIDDDYDDDNDDDDVVVTVVVPELNKAPPHEDVLRE